MSARPGARDVTASPRGRRIPLRTKLLSVAVPPAAILLLTASFVYAVLDQSIRATEDVVRLRNAIIEMNLMLRLMVDEESAVRGYVISGDDAYLAPYRASADAFDAVVDAIRPAIADASDDAARLDRIVALHDRWDREVAQREIALTAAGRQEDAAGVVSSGIGKAMVDAIRAETGALIDETWTTLEERRSVRDQTSLDAQRAVLIGPAVAAFLAVVSVVVIARRVSRDIDEVAEVAESLEAGRLDRRSGVTSADEVGALARAFNAMADRLQGTIAAEQAAVEHLEVQRAALEEANAELQTFSYSVSHDLRTPLRTIDGFSAILLEDHAQALDDEGRRLLGRVRAASQRMGDLIDDLLLLSRVNRTAIQRRDIDISAMAEEVVEALRQGEPEREVQVVIEPGLRTSADPGLARVVLDNLIGNAWKFTRGRARPTIVLDRVAPDVFRIRDDGAGFDQAYVGKLFQPFQRLHHGDIFPGTGIGLATVQRVLRRHGGAARAQGAVDEGASFWFSFSRPIDDTVTDAH